MKVNLVVSLAKRHLRAAADDQERRLLGVGAGHGVEHVDGAGAVRDQGDSQTAETGISVGREPGPRLVTANDGR